MFLYLHSGKMLQLNSDHIMVIIQNKQDSEELSPNSYKFSLHIIIYHITSDIGNTIYPGSGASFLDPWLLCS
jgi:hypothetical protein